MSTAVRDVREDPIIDGLAYLLNLSKAHRPFGGSHKDWRGGLKLAMQHKRCRSYDNSIHRNSMVGVLFWRRWERRDRGAMIRKEGDEKRQERSGFGNPAKAVTASLNSSHGELRTSDLYSSVKGRG